MSPTVDPFNLGNPNSISMCFSMMAVTLSDSRIGHCWLHCWTQAMTAVLVVRDVQREEKKIADFTVVQFFIQTGIRLLNSCQALLFKNRLHQLFHLIVPLLLDSFRLDSSHGRQWHR